MIIDYFQLALTSIRHRKLRSWLTMIGIFIGIAAVVSLISLGQGMQSSINEQFRQIGSNRIMIQPGGISFGPPTTASEITAAQLTEDDVKIVQKTKGVEFASGILTLTAIVEFKDETNYIQVWGNPTDPYSQRNLEAIGLLAAEFGRQLSSSDKYKAIIGHNIAYNTFKKDIQLGDKIKINSQQFQVIGIQKKAGTGIHDIIIRIPLDTARDLFNEQNKVSFIGATSKQGLAPSEIAEDIKKELRKFRNVKEDEEDFTVQTAEQTIAQLNIILDIVQIFLIGIAAISLIVGGIGIMNTMYTGVVERTRDIGIMKAIGAKNSHILLLFLIESGTLGLAGGIIGVIIGLSFSLLVQFIVTAFDLITLKVYIGFPLLLGSLLFSFIIGAMSGVFPAKQASKLQPVEALRE